MSNVIPIHLATGRVHAELARKGEQVSYTRLLDAMGKTLKALPGAGQPIPAGDVTQLSEVLVAVLDNGDEAMWINGQLVLSSEAEMGDPAVFPTAQRIAEAFDLRPILVEVKTPDAIDWDFSDIYQFARTQIAQGDATSSVRRLTAVGNSVGGFVVGNRAKVSFTRESGTIVELIEQEGLPLRAVIEFAQPQSVDVPEGAVATRFEIAATSITATWRSSAPSAGGQGGETRAFRHSEFILAKIDWWLLATDGSDAEIDQLDEALVRHVSDELMRGKRQGSLQANRGDRAYRGEWKVQSH